MKLRSKSELGRRVRARTRDADGVRLLAAGQYGDSVVSSVLNVKQYFSMPTVS